MAEQGLTALLFPRFRQSQTVEKKRRPVGDSSMDLTSLIRSDTLGAQVHIIIREY